MHGMTVLNVHNNRPPVRRITEEMRTRLFVLKIEVDHVMGKAQYPISSLEEVAIPSNQAR